MEYNTSLKKLILPEYGRNIQNMVDFIMAIEDRQQRNLAAQSIVDVMGNLYPYLRDIPDFKHKLWDHLAIMSDFQLDIDYPYDLPTREALAERPNTIPYNNGEIKYKHYGRIVEMMIKRAAEYEEGMEKDSLIQMIADHMKKCYLTWNKETVDDEKVMADFHELAKGRIDVPEDFQLSETKDLMFSAKKDNSKKKQFNNGKKNQNYKKDMRKN
ncbi:MAG TPA: DUF4290 domain-containing protein [Prolixibacteraceae bacterium]|nr:DUF4290 domain-containing protein [Bacteroidales bacterium]HPB05340.1 DUF4290 domain-containing protein [Prolixibacteraceae bacterium]HQN94623.1 DUF4290 domain-containing protein [Prolixibacteraceae bacterium]HUM88177.1 DUF4290 domain-containing protein [Prolixibacteraceae bacterium]